jgi:tetratricopeptide (TPR) repeat protein
MRNRIKKLITSVCLTGFLLFSLLIKAQDESKGVIVSGDNSNLKIVKGKTYAVIVGIDNYQSPKINHLNYAAADAIAFEKFLLSKAGGEVPKENIVKFLNDSATTGRFKVLGLGWVTNKADHGDRVYLYFSGHGITVSGSDSYFLANNFASDVSVANIEEAGTEPLHQLKTNIIGPLTDRGVQVILIIDACRSHLADSLRIKTVNTFNPDLNTAEMNKGDIMLLSSSNGQESLETSRDGINHGIFTYFLLKGLYGLADTETNPGLITFNKLKNYVTSMVSDYTNENQIPKIEYKPTGLENPNPLIAKVDTNLLAYEKTGFNGGKKIRDPDNTVALNSEKKGLLSSGDLTLDTRRLYTKFLASLRKGILWSKIGALHYFNRIEKTVKDSDLINDAALNLTAVLVDSGQAIINAYLAADKKIGYGREMNNTFARGAIIFDKIYKLSNKYFPAHKENSMYLKQYYFMKGRSLTNTGNKSKQNKALAFLYKAYKLDSNAAYIYHTLGLIYIEKEIYDSALYFLREAIDQAPLWAFPYNAIGTIYLEAGRVFNPGPWYGRPEIYFNKSLELDSTYPVPYINLGDYYKLKGDFKKSEEYYNKALSFYTCNSYCLYQLGSLYEQQKRIAEAKNYYTLSYQCDHNIVSKMALKNKKVDRKTYEKFRKLVVPPAAISG